MDKAPEFLYPDGYAQFAPDKRTSDAKYEDSFIIEDLLDFPVVACDSSSSGNAAVTYEDVAELEWLSNFVEGSFSSEDLQKLQLRQGIKARTNAPSESRQYQFQTETDRQGPMTRPEVSVPGKARSKRSRAASGSWNSRLHATEFPTRPDSHKKKESGPEAGTVEGRRCLHCATEKTPQWRTGPLGPKTLCNACGVRYKSGRLVPEYRPAASPTFVLTRHSNSHRKVIELRRQKEVMQQQQLMYDEDWRGDATAAVDV